MQELKASALRNRVPVLHHPSVHIKTREASKVYPKCFIADHVTFPPIRLWDSQFSDI